MAITMFTQKPARIAPLTVNTWAASAPVQKLSRKRMPITTVA